MFSHYGVNTRIPNNNNNYAKSPIQYKNSKSKKNNIKISVSQNRNCPALKSSIESYDLDNLPPVKKLNTLFDIFVSLLQEEPFSSSLESVALKLFNGQSATVWVIDNEKCKLVSPTNIQIIDINKGIIGACVSQKVIINSQKPSDHPNFDVTVDSITNSTLYIPIFKSLSPDDEIFGVIVVYASSNGVEGASTKTLFTEEDVKLAELFSKKLAQYSHFLSLKPLYSQGLIDLSCPSEITLGEIEQKLKRLFNSKSVEFWSSDIFNEEFLRYNFSTSQFEQVEVNPGVVSIALNRNHCFNIPNVLHSPYYDPEIDGATAEAVLIQGFKGCSNNYAIVIRRPNMNSNNFNYTKSGILKPSGPPPSSFSFHEEQLLKRLTPFISAVMMKEFGELDDANDDELSRVKPTSMIGTANFAARLKALLEVAEIISGVLDIEMLIGTIMERSCSLLNSERCSLFLVDIARKELVTRFHGGLKKSIRMPIGRGIVGHTATTGNIVNITDAYSDPRFDKQVDLKTGFKTKTILTVPIYNNRGEIAGVTEVINKLDGGTFDEDDIKMMMAFNVFCGISLDNAKLYQSSLDLTRQLRGFVEMSSALNKTKNIHAVLEEILTSAMEVINATRATIFMMEDESIGIKVTKSNPKLLPFVSIGNSIVHGTIFADDIVEMKEPKVFSKQEIFYKVNQTSDTAIDGLALIADKKAGNELSRATTILISEDALKEESQQQEKLQQLNLSQSKPNYNEEVTYDNICGIPMVSSDQKIMGVMELCCLGKILPEDLKLLDCYAVFAAVSIERSELQEIANLGKIDVQMNQYLLPDEKKKYSIPSKLQIEANELQNLFGIRFDAVAYDGIGHFKVLWAIADTFSLLEEFKISNEKWFRFLLEISQTYKQVPYHNWRHAVDVTQFVTYQIKLTHLEERLTKFELLGFIVSAICHDANHDGFSNVFNEKAETPLGILYKNQSVMETHHCTVAINVISKEECNIFQYLDSDQNKNMWNLIIQLILITDMAKHFDFLKQVNSDIDQFGKYDETDPKNRLKIMQCILKCGDISNVSRPFELADKWCDVLCEEFFRQGDLELASGMEYTSPLNDREHLDKPKSQIGFYTFVCLPLYQTAARIYPELQVNVDQVQSNLKIWKSHDEEKNPK